MLKDVCQRLYFTHMRSKALRALLSWEARLQAQQKGSPLPRRVLLHWQSERVLPATLQPAGMRGFLGVTCTPLALCDPQHFPIKWQHLVIFHYDIESQHGGAKDQSKSHVQNETSCGGVLPLQANYFFPPK